jgi:hypothetical protein
MDCQLNNLHKYLINTGKKYNENKYKLFFLSLLLQLLNNVAEISNYMNIDIDFSFLHNENYWSYNYQESNIKNIIFFLNKPIYTELNEEINKMLIVKSYFIYETTLLNFYSIFSNSSIHYTRGTINTVLNECVSINEQFNIFVNILYTFSINKLLNNIYSLWLTNKIKYLDNQHENQKLYTILHKLVCQNTQSSNISQQYIPDLQFIDHNSYLDYSLKWSFDDYTNHYKLLEKYYNQLNSTTEVITKPRKKYIPASIKDIVWNKRAVNGCVRCEVCNKIITPHTCHYSHYISEKNGGPTTPNNLTILCQPCNLSMGSKNYHEFVTMYRHNITL